MVLSTITIDEINVTPRGGVAGTAVTVPGSGFGPPTGVVRFDPLGENVAAAIVSWAPNQVVFTVPVLITVNRNVVVQIENAAGNDAVTMPFWCPAIVGPFPVKLGYQWPSAEAGSAEQDIDNPRIFSAADFNRLLDFVRLIDPNGDGIADLAAALDDAGTPRTWADIVALVSSFAGGGTITRPYAAGVVVNDVVYQRADGLADKTDATSLVTGPAIGIVVAVDIPLVGQVTIKQSGDLGGFAGLVPGTIYIASRSPGGIVREDDTGNPFFPGAAGNFVQAVGVAASATTLLVVATPAAFLEN